MQRTSKLGQNNISFFCVFHFWNSAPAISVESFFLSPPGASSPHEDHQSRNLSFFSPPVRDDTIWIREIGAGELLSWWQRSGGERRELNLCTLEVCSVSIVQVENSKTFSNYCGMNKRTFFRIFRINSGSDLLCRFLVSCVV